MSLIDFEVIKRLGEGAYSSVYHVRRIADHEYYALKKVRMQKLSDKEKENALNEVRILASIRHPNIVAYKEAFIDDASQSLCIIMEYADSGDLFQQICDHQKNNTLFKEEDIWRMFIQMVRGLKCLHEIMIFHRDLKSANIFLNKDGTAKLGDMNVSKVAKKGMLYTQTGTPYYASPEVWRDQPYDNKSDIWSLGCVLYESITLKPPFRADDMQGLYKKVLRGVYPKIPNIYSTDLSSLVKQLVQVTPQMRPSCDRILEMPAIKKRLEKLLPTDQFYDSQSSLLNTIRVPKNLLYLTDRLPKPSYDSPSQKKRMDDEEKLRRRTHDAGNMLQDAKHPKKSKNDSVSQQPGTQKQEGPGKKKPVPKQARGRSDMRADPNQITEANTGEESNAKIGTASQVDEDRRSVVSKGSVSQSQNPQVPSVLRKNSTKRGQKQQQQPAVVISHRARDNQSDEGLNEEYQDDQFERDDNYSKSPLPDLQKGVKPRQSINDRESGHQIELPQKLQVSSPQTKRSGGASKNQQASSLPPQMPSAQSMLLSSRPQINYSLLNNAQQPGGGASSIDRIYAQKVLPGLPSLGENGQSRKNIAYINISGEGAKPVGYLGIKKAEKDLIMRRYKYNHHASDPIQRVAMIYGHGQQPPQGPQQYQYSYGGNSIYSPYLANQMPSTIAQGQNNNLSGIIKRNKYNASPIMEENSSIGGLSGQAAIRLPKLGGGLGRQNLDHGGAHQQSQASLPQIGQQIGNLAVPQVNGQGILSKQQQQAYQPYIIKPSKIKSISKPVIGINSEKLNMNKYGAPSGVPGVGSLIDRQQIGGAPAIEDHLSQPVSRTNQISGLGSNGTGSATGNANQSTDAGAAPRSSEVRKIYKKRSKPSASTGNEGQPGVSGTRNGTGGGLPTGISIGGRAGDALVEQSEYQ